MWESSASDLVTPDVEHQRGSVDKLGVGEEFLEAEIGSGVKGAAQAHLYAAQLDADAAIAKAAVGE